MRDSGEGISWGLRSSKSRHLSIAKRRGPQLVAWFARKVTAFFFFYLRFSFVTVCSFWFWISGLPSEGPSILAFDPLAMFVWLPWDKTICSYRWSLWHFLEPSALVFQNQAQRRGLRLVIDVNSWKMFSSTGLSWRKTNSLLVGFVRDEFLLDTDVCSVSTVRRNVVGVLLACCRALSHPQRKRSLDFVEQRVVLPDFSGQSAKGITDIRPAGGPWRVVKVLGWLWHHLIAKCATALRTLSLHISPESLRLQQSNLNKYYLSIHVLYIS